MPPFITARGGASVRVDGLAELRRNIAKLGDGMARRVYQKAVGAGGKVVAAAAKAQVPRRTGALGKSIAARVSSKPREELFGVKITVKAGLFSSQRTARRRGRSRKGKGGSGIYKPDAVERYYRFLETGTKYHPATPFLKPSLEGSAAKVLAVIKGELAAGLARESAKLRT